MISVDATSGDRDFFHRVSTRKHSFGRPLFLLVKAREECSPALRTKTRSAFSNLGAVAQKAQKNFS